MVDCLLKDASRKTVWQAFMDGPSSLLTSRVLVHKSFIIEKLWLANNFFPMVLKVDGKIF